MGVSIIGVLKFLILERGALSEFGKKHAVNINAALRDALPLIEKLRQAAMPESETAERAEVVVRKAEQLTRHDPVNNPPPGEPGRDAG